MVQQEPFFGSKTVQEKKRIKKNSLFTNLHQSFEEVLVVDYILDFFLNEKSKIY